jgi:phosphohistidine phosphatase
MLLYLIQHGEAKKEQEDIKRPLNEKGIEDINKIGKFLEQNKISVNRILHSTKLRAKQTAEILANYIKTEQGLIEVSGLEPNAYVNEWYEKIVKEENDIAIVGHLPYLSKLTSKLICEDENKKIVDFKQGSVLCLEKQIDNLFVIKFFILPEKLV